MMTSSARGLELKKGDRKVELEELPNGMRFLPTHALCLALLFKVGQEIQTQACFAPAWVQERKE